MSGPTARYIFALICLLGAIAVTTGAALEVSRRRRGASLISGFQFWLRMFSTLLWDLILASTSYALISLWPEGPGDMRHARQFVSVMSGVILLVGIALVLLFYDVFLLRRQQELQARRFASQLSELAAGEVARLQKQEDALAKQEADRGGGLNGRMR